MRYTFTLAISVTIISFLGACSRLPQRPEGMPELVPCTIEVSFGGETLENVGVLLHPKDRKTNPWPAGGSTDAQGRCVLKTAAYYTGVVPGEYTVTFQKYAEPEMGADGMPKPAPSLIPEKYGLARNAETILVTKDKKRYVFELEAKE